MVDVGNNHFVATHETKNILLNLKDLFLLPNLITIGRLFFQFIYLQHFYFRLFNINFSFNNRSYRYL